MRLGIFGGTFDPVHYGHLLLAESAREQCRLDQVWFMPAASPPHKSTQQISPAERRVEMLELAVAGHASFDVCTHEIERGGVSYTWQTLADMHTSAPISELFFLLGADSLHDLPQWREPAKICELATLVVVARPGFGPVDFSPLSQVCPAERLQHFARHVVFMPQVDISSRDLRQRAAEHRSIRYQTPRAVERYIETHALYGRDANEHSSLVEK